MACPNKPIANAEAGCRGFGTSRSVVVLRLRIQFSTITAESLKSDRRIDNSSLHLVFRREGETTSFSMLNKEGSVRVVMEE